MRIPRLLPLIAVAIGGVLAVNALAGARSLPDLLSSARAFAEEVAQPKAVAKGGTQVAAKTEPKGAAATTPTERILDGSIPVRPQGPVCAPVTGDLAKEAGLSPAELSVLQQLGTRRGQIESLEKNVDVQQQLLTAAEAKVDAKIAVMRALIADMQGLLGQADEKQKSENARLVKIYEGMKPKDAAAQLAIMKDDVRLDIVAGMKERNLSAILGAMPPVAAKELTEKLALRYATSAPVQAAQAAMGPAAKGPAPKTATPAPKTAAATPPAAAPAAKTG